MIFMISHDWSTFYKNIGYMETKDKIILSIAKIPDFDIDKGLKS